MAPKLKKRVKTRTRKTAPRRKSPAALPEGVPGLARPAQRALLAAGITEIAHFAKIAEGELAALHGMGPNALEKIKTFLKAHGVSLSGAPAKAPPRKTKRKKRRS